MSGIRVTYNPVTTIYGTEHMAGGAPFASGYKAYDDTTGRVLGYVMRSPHQRTRWVATTRLPRLGFHQAYRELSAVRRETYRTRDDAAIALRHARDAQDRAATA
jgi:hypothetical protein